ncbi:MAG: methyltransferase domain-containing protein [candidate division Zixibacteria bacterium]|nr:methyltransferase domain-containing protein [candidate division Zixibacteria bacterium]
MGDRSNRVCPVEEAGSLDTIFRRLLQNPRRILKPYLRAGMTVLDFGCGPGFFSIEMARMVGESGRVIAADLQEGMLQILRDKISGTELESRIVLHRCGPDKISVTERVDFALLFYVVHEIPDKDSFFKEIASILNPKGRVLIVEPPFHVNEKAFAATLDKASASGLTVTGRPKMFLNKCAVLTKV